MILTLLLLISLTSSAAVDEDRASRLIQEAIALHKKGSFQASAERFFEAYEACRRPNQLANAAKAFEKAGRPKRALSLWQTYRGLDGVSPEQRQKADEQIESLSRAPTPPKKVKPKPAVTKQELTAPPPDDSSTLPYVFVGLGGAMAIASGVLWGIASSNLSTLEDQTAVRDRDGLVKGMTYESYMEEVDGINSQRVWSGVLAGGALVCVAGGVIFWFVDSPEQVSVAPTRDGGFLLWSGRF